MEIKTDRLFLRTLAEAHAALVKSFSDQFETESNALEWIRWINNRHDICFMFYIWIVQTSKLIGHVYFHNKVELAGEVEIGYGINEEHRCMNYATEAAKAVLQFAFEQAGQDVLSAIIKSENVASHRVIEKLGFTYSGVRTVFICGENCGFNYFKLYRENFHK